MGLQDRDYWRERYRKTESGRSHPRYNPDPFGSPRTARRMPVPGTPPWGKIVFWLLLATIVVFAATKALTRPGRLPLPENGWTYWYAPQGADLAPFSVVAPAQGARMHAVRLSDWNTGKLVAVVTVRAGESAKVSVPLGLYEVTLASGDNWYGPEKLFGFRGDERKATRPMHFYRTPTGTTGNNIDLANRLDGNLQTRPVTPLDRLERK